jgi:LysR family transcriptional regulator, hydrogen peroxide-inducible genes activator
MELHQWRYYAAVARLGNFTRAAEACGVSQPTLSQQIGKLELELGKPLFDRLGRGAALTDAGQAIRERVEQALALIDEVKATVAAAAVARRLTVAAIPTVAPYLLPAVLMRFREECPDVRIEAREHTTAECVERLNAGELDLAIFALPMPDDHFVAEPILTEDMLLALPANHRLVSRSRISIHDLRDEPFVLLHEAHCLSGQAAWFCARHALAPVVTARLHQLATVLELVRLGQGVTLVPAMAAAADTHPGRVYRRLAGESPMRTLAVVRNPHRFRNESSRRFTELAGLAAVAAVTPAGETSGASP